jgi:zeaxanthin glucosyltransferase
MARLGAFCFPGSGHINPMTALCRALELRGHSVVMFGIADVEARVRGAGIEFHQIGATDYPPGTLKALDDRLGKLSGLAAFRFTVERVERTGRMILRDAPAAVREERIDALLIDEMDVAGTVAEYLDIPFISIAIIPPILDDFRAPPFFFGWRDGKDTFNLLRNRLAMQVAMRIGAPLLRLLNTQRTAWELKPFRRPSDSLSRIAQITQVPRVLEFDSLRCPKELHYTGPWVNARQRPPVEFPWDRLDGRPLVYASLGTLQNGAEPVFRTIAEACSTLPVQLVISLGGGLHPERLGKLAGNPIVVRFAPQLELIKRSRAVITHAGINTTLEALSEGVPLVAIPLGNDQPGVAARVAVCGAGVVVPRRKLFAPRLRKALRQVLEDPPYLARARDLAQAMRKIDGPSMAAEIIEQSLQLQTLAPSVQHAE